MAQQINLCSPILLTQKKYFSAHTMAASLGVFVLLGGALAGTWSWNLHSAAKQYTATMESQGRDMANLQAALERNKAAALPKDAGLARQLEDHQAQLSQRKALLAALQDGVMKPGQGYSERLKFLASSTPSQVWISGVSLTSESFHVTGRTLEPATLNDWVSRMATHPLLQGLQLTQVQVRAEAASSALSPVASTAVPSTNANTSARKVWAFELGSTRVAQTATTVAQEERKP